MGDLVDAARRRRFEQTSSVDRESDTGDIPRRIGHQEGDGIAGVDRFDPGHRHFLKIPGRDREVVASRVGMFRQKQFVHHLVLNHVGVDIRRK